jgi:sugar lactone lactonase YvrE
MRGSRSFVALSWLGILGAVIAGAFPGPVSAQDPSGKVSPLEVVATVNEPPGNITCTPTGRVILSLHQFMNPEWRVAELLPDGTLVPFPNEKWNTKGDPDSTFDSVLGLQADAQQIVWFLDNGMRGGGTPKLVAWDLRIRAVHKIVPLPPPATVPSSFVNDLAVDRNNESVYIADPAGGANAALIVVDLKTGKARRVLEGHASVVPEEIDLVVDGKAIERKLPDGTLVRPRIGVNPVALDRFNYWLYYGPMHATSLYRVRTGDLRNASMDAGDLALRVERYSEKPICDGMTMDRAGRIYVTEVGANAVGIIRSDRIYQRWIEDPRLSWPDAFAFDPNGRIYIVANQLHRTAVLNGGVEAVQRPFPIFRVDAPTR